MDYNEYTASGMVRERHAELVALARERALAAEARGRRRPLRATLGTALIRAGAWLLRDEGSCHEQVG